VKRKRTVNYLQDKP